MSALAERLEVPDGLDADHFLHERGYTDGLPVVAPTPAAVERMLGSSGVDPTEAVAVLPPRRGVATMEKIAVNAVMAGCEPEMLPVVVAALRAFAVTEFNGALMQCTENPATTMLLVNGPIRRRIDMNAGFNCIGVGARANLAIGRAVQLVLRNVGADRGRTPQPPHGFPGRISFCFAEDEESSPWAPLSVDRGFAASQSVVTIAAAQGTSNIFVPTTSTALGLLHHLAVGMINPGANNYCFGEGDPLLVLNPTHAGVLAREGYTKPQVQEYLFEKARFPIEWYSETTLRLTGVGDRAVRGQIPMTTAPERLAVVVAGGPGWHSTFVPTYNDSRMVSVEVAGPDAGR